MRGSKVAGWCGSILTSVLMAAVFAAVIVCSAEQSFAREPEVSSDAKVKAGTSGLRVSLLYPPNGVLGSNQTQMIQVGVTVTPSPGTSLNSYRLQLKMRAPSGHLAFSQQLLGFHPLLDVVGRNDVAVDDQHHLLGAREVRCRHRRQQAAEGNRSAKDSSFQVPPVFHRAFTSAVSAGLEPPTNSIHPFGRPGKTGSGR